MSNDESPLFFTPVASAALEDTLFALVRLQMKGDSTSVKRILKNLSIKTLNFVQDECDLRIREFMHLAAEYRKIKQATIQLLLENQSASS